MDIGRRGFIAGAAACAACSGDDDEQTSSGVDDTAKTSAGETTPNPIGPSRFRLGEVAELTEELASGDGRMYVPEGRMWLLPYPSLALDSARDLYDEESLVGMEAGLLALSQKCTHLGCRVPDCATNGRFECPCHGAIFNRVGEYVSGPQPRGLDRFPVSIEQGTAFVDLRVPVPGLDPGLSTIEDDPTGPSCVGEATG